MRPGVRAVSAVAGRTSMHGTKLIMSEKLTAGGSYITAGATTGVGILSLSEWAVIIGILATLATFALNYVVQVRKLKMEEREHQARMKLYESEEEPEQ